MKIFNRSIYLNLRSLLEVSSGFREYSAVIHIEPQKSILDEDVQVTCKGFKPNSKITLNLNLISEEDKMNFSSYGHFLTTETGEIDVMNTESLGGSYSGKKPMGLFWSMHSKKGHFTRQVSRNANNPFHYVINAFSGHIGCCEIEKYVETGNNIISSAIFDKYLLSSNIQRIEVQEGRVRGTMFVPKYKFGKLPGIIFLLGGMNRGKIMEDKSAVFANKGYVTMTLAFFGVEDLPKNYHDLDLEYFEEALNVFKNHEKVDENKVGLYGISKGGEIVFSMLSFLKGIKAAVVVNSSTSYCYTHMTYKNHTVKPMPLDVQSITEQAVATKDQFLDWSRLIDFPNPENYPESDLRFENNPADLLIIGCEDDHVFNTITQVEYARRKLEKAGKKNYEIIRLPGAGHLLDIPNTPLCYDAPHAYLPKKIHLFYGGNVEDHAKATLIAWKKMIDFYRFSFQ